MNDYLIKAIQKLKPTAEFSLTDNDYSTIKWDVLDGTAPTTSQIKQAIEEIKSDEAIEVEAKASAKASLLERLGITADEAALLLA